MSDTQPIKLLPCPFCGGEAEWADGEQKHEYGNEQVNCSQCYARTVPDSDKESAAKWWNARGDTSLDFIGEVEGQIAEIEHKLDSRDAQADAMKELLEAAEQCRYALSLLPVDALGMGEAFDGQGLYQYPLRDELATKLTAAIAKAKEQNK